MPSDKPLQKKKLPVLLYSNNNFHKKRLFKKKWFAKDFWYFSFKISYLLKSVLYTLAILDAAYKKLGGGLWLVSGAYS